MGCGGSKAGGDTDAPAAKSAAPPRQPHHQFVEDLFVMSGTVKKLSAGEAFITQGDNQRSAFFIKEGEVDLLLKGEKDEVKLVARGPGDILGELSLLLGHPATVTAMPKTAVTVIEVVQEKLIEMLKESPVNAGRLFKALAMVLAERISELSGKLRANVVASTSATPSTKASHITPTDINKARSMFNLPKDEKLIGVYQCSVRHALFGPALEERVIGSEGQKTQFYTEGWRGVGCVPGGGVLSSLLPYLPYLHDHESRGGKVTREVRWPRYPTARLL